jgi:hypothetical protein
MGEEEMAARLRALLAMVDRVPQAALQAANEAIAWRDPDGALARLAADSGLEISGLRGQPRLLTFRSGQTIIELEVSSDGGVARLLGQPDPPGEATVTIESAGQSRAARADSQGRFSAADLTAGWMRVIVVSPGCPGERTVTEWFRS